MKAAVLYGREDVRVEEIEARPLRSGEVRIAIEAALTCGTDLKVFKRGYHAKMIVPPAVFGHELAGTISEACETSGWTVGERIVVANSAPCGNCYHCRRQRENLCDDLLFLNGAYAESIVIPPRLVQKNLYRLAPGTNFSSAALAEPLACVVMGIEELRLQPDSHVLIVGAGPIGLMFVRLASYLGCSVTVIGRGSNRLARAKRLGAGHVVESGTIDDVRERLSKGDSRLFDFVIEAVGSPETWELALELVRKGGAINLFGGCPAGTKVCLDTARLHYASIRLCSSFHHSPQTFRRALSLIEEGIIQSTDFVDGECLLDSLPELFRGMVKGNRSVKTLVRVRG